MKRHGFTLVEMIAVMAVMALVMGFSVVLLVQLFDFQWGNDEYSDRMRSIDRFVAAFRQDVHTYGKPEILIDGTALLRWNNEAETVEYTAAPGTFPNQQTIVRTVRKDGQQSCYESYWLLDRTALHFAEGKDNDTGLAALSLWTAPPGTEMPKLDELNPFDRTLPELLEQRINPKYAGNWRTIIARYSENVKE